MWLGETVYGKDTNIMPSKIHAGAVKCATRKSPHKTRQVPLQSNVSAGYQLQGIAMDICINFRALLWTYVSTSGRCYGHMFQLQGVAMDICINFRALLGTYVSTSGFAMDILGPIPLKIRSNR